VARIDEGDDGGVGDLGRCLGAIRGMTPRGRGEPSPDPVGDYGRVVALVDDLHARHDRLVAIRDLVAEWRDLFGADEALLGERLLRRARIIAATCLAVGDDALRERRFGWAIVDEAARALESEIIVPLVQARRSILIGDEKQLPPHVDNDIADEKFRAAGIRREDIKKSLFASLAERADQPTSYPKAVLMLKRQYRMHPDIRGLVSAVFYDNKLTDGEGCTADTRAHGLPWLRHAVVWRSTSKLPDRIKAETEVGRRPGWYVNDAEARAIEELLERIETTYRGAGVAKRVGIISGYKKQVEALTERLLARGGDRWRALDLTIETVDSYQGNERDIIIYSAVRSNAARVIGFLEEQERLNVALSRARELLCIVGDVDTLVNARDVLRRDNPYARAYDHMRANRGSYLIEDLR